MPHPLIAEIERLIRRDPARRGLIGEGGRALASGQLEGAATHLSQHASHVGIVTGFYVPSGVPPAAETDGPPGAVLLTATLRSLGAEATLLTDAWCHSAVAVAGEAAGLPPDSVIRCDDADSDWRQRLFDDHPFSHLIAVERIGPCHTEESLQAQQRDGAPPLEEFRQSVSVENRDRCHNMRGEAIDQHTGDLHRLFEELNVRLPDARSIGIGDGGNEIGMGSIPWEELASRLEGECRGLIPCRIATDWTIIAGTSNWGAYALAAAVAVLRGRADVLTHRGVDSERAVIERMVKYGPAVDGISRRQDVTVDGLPFLTYIQPWIAIRRLLGLPD